jgi:hypothetical protein
MQLHELLRETARRFRDGEYLWVQHAMAYLAPEGAFSYGRAKPCEATDEDAACFCGLGGIARTAGVDSYHALELKYPNIGQILPRAIRHKPRKLNTWVMWDITPFTNWNDSDYRERDEVIAALERAAALATPPDPED